MLPRRWRTMSTKSCPRGILGWHRTLLRDPSGIKRSPTELVTPTSASSVLLKPTGSPLQCCLKRACLLKQTEHLSEEPYPAYWNVLCWKNHRRKWGGTLSMSTVTQPPKHEDDDGPHSQFANCQ